MGAMRANMGAEHQPEGTLVLNALHVNNSVAEMTGGLWSPIVTAENNDEPLTSPKLWKPSELTESRPRRTVEDLYSMYATLSVGEIEMSMKDLVQQKSLKSTRSFNATLTNVNEDPNEKGTSPMNRTVHKNAPDFVPNRPDSVKPSKSKSSSTSHGTIARMITPQRSTAKYLNLLSPKVSPRPTPPQSPLNLQVESIYSQPTSSPLCHQKTTYERYSSADQLKEPLSSRPLELPIPSKARPLSLHPHSNHCSGCSTHIIFFKTRCLVCGRAYCNSCVKHEMGSMPEGRKCTTCIGRSIHKRYRNKAGKGGCWPFGISSSAKEAELFWITRRWGTAGHTANRKVLENGASGNRTPSKASLRSSPRQTPPMSPMYLM